MCLLAVGKLYSQFVPKAVRTDNTVIQGLATLVEPHGWLHFNETSNLDPDSYFNNYATAMGLGENDEMVKTDEWEDEGQTHFRFRQYHKSIPVKYGDYILHAKNCKVILAHGKLVENLDIVLPATLSEATALQNALDAIGAAKYAWEDPDWEYQAQEDMEDPNATWYPDGELEIFGEPDVDMTDDNFNLAYRFQIRSIDPFESRIVYVDAHNGQILSNLDAHVHATGTCTTLFYGTRTFETEQRGWPNNDFILKDKTRGDKIWTKKHNAATSPWWVIPNVTDDNNSWGTPNAPSTTAHWAAQMAWDYFLDKWNWEGCDGKGRQLRLLAEYNQTIYDAYPRLDFIGINTNGGNHDATLDRIGHEFTHGVAHHKAKLTFSTTGEASALMESFCDIFGEAIERNVLGNNDWLFGADNGATERDLAVPTNFGHPNTYLQSGFWSTTGDAHTNAGVQNRWFNLLAVGGTQNGITVVGIGFDKAVRVAKGNLFNFMTPGSNYADARTGAIATSTAIWGKCSNETIQTTNAWAACGVGAVFAGCMFNITGPYAMCANYPNAENWLANVLPGESVTWTYPGWWNVTISGDGLALNGFFSLPTLPVSVELTATSSSNASASYSVLVEECIAPPFHCGGTQGLLAPPSNRFTPKEHLHSKTTVFPNPTNGRITCVNQTLAEVTCKVVVVDLFGRVLLEIQANGSVFEIDTEPLSPGLYFLKINYPDSIETTSFVKN